jgi:hypothetical protein
MYLSRQERDRLVMTRRGRTVMTTLKRVVDEDVGGEEVVVDVDEAVDEVVPLEGEAVEEEEFRNLFRRPWESVLWKDTTRCISTSLSSSRFCGSRYTTPVHTNLEMESMMKDICEGRRTKNDVVHESIEKYREVFTKANREVNVLVDVRLLVKANPDLSAIPAGGKLNTNN